MLLAFMEGDQSRFGREQLAWLKRGLRDVDQAYLWDRVNDYDDTYSMDDLMKLADLLWGEAAGNPTESPTG